MHRFGWVLAAAVLAACSSPALPPTPTVLPPTVAPTPNIQATVQRAVELTQVANALATTSAPTATPVRAATTAPPTSAPSATPAPVIHATPSTQAPQPTSVPTTAPAPRQLIYNHAPINSQRVDAGAVWTFQMGELPEGMTVNANVSVVFNSRLSYVEGSPDIDITVVGPSGVVWAQSRAKNGTSVSFVASQPGAYRMEFSNAYSRVSAKQVSVQFLTQ